MEPINDINLQLNSIQEGTIKVHSQIINDLSSGIYSSPASCIKELVNNSFDADSSKVIIRLKPINDTIIIADDGNGMNAIDFDKNFAWISKSNKRNSGELSPKFRRPLIGKIGIGFIAVNEICKTMRIISSKENENFKFIADINFESIVKPNEDEGIIKGTYKLINEEEEKEAHYTIIELTDLKESVKDILNDQQYHSNLARSKNKDFDDFSFRSMKDIITHHNTGKLKSFKEENAYVSFIIDLASYIPVEYIEGGPIVGINDTIISEIVEAHKNLKFKVDLDGIDLKKPTYFEIKDGKKFAYSSFSRSIPSKDNLDAIVIMGYFFAYDHLLTPRELNGIAIRIRNIPIAVEYGYDTTFLAYPNYVDQIFRNWVSGEVYVLKGLEDAMNIDRKSFRVTHNHYLALQNFVHKYLREEFFSQEVNDIYQENRIYRADNKAEEQNEKKREILGSDKVNINVVNRKSQKKSTSFNSELFEVPPVSVEVNKETSNVSIDFTPAKKVSCTKSFARSASSTRAKA